MNDYIKREDAITAVKDNSYSLTDDEYIEINGYGAIEQIEGIPSADVVEVRHGTDKGYEDSYGWKDVCSICGCKFRTSKSANYCPNCGARMDREEQEQ